MKTKMTQFGSRSWVKGLRHLPTIALAGLVLVGCGKEAFVVTQSTVSQTAPGTFSIAPRVDILFAEDDTGSIYEAYDEVSKQMPTLLSSLEKSGWDYHFATAGLTNIQRPINQILASKQDVNWGSQAVAPYPGGQLSTLFSVGSAYFRTPEQYSEFIVKGEISNQMDGDEQGFKAIAKALDTKLTGTGFTREGALLVILAFTNGNDTSDVNYCQRSIDGIMVPCETLGQAGTLASSLETYRTKFLAVKKNQSSLVRFHAAVAQSNSKNCKGSVAQIGTRYTQMAAALGGKTYDICTQSVSDVLAGVSADLEVQKKSFRTRYLFIDQVPDLATVKILRYRNGRTDLAPDSLTESETNGWKFIGKVDNVPAIDAPVAMSPTSGYAFELSGDAKLVGYDTASISYKPAGVQDTAAK